MTIATHELKDMTDPKLNVLSFYDLNRWTTIPLPSEKKWRDQTEKDEDLQLLKHALENETPLYKQILKEQGYHQPFKEGKLIYEDGSWFHYEKPKRARVRQLRTRVVPRTLRQAIFFGLPYVPNVGTHRSP